MALVRLFQIQHNRKLAVTLTPMKNKRIAASGNVLNILLINNSN